MAVVHPLPPLLFIIFCIPPSLSQNSASPALLKFKNSLSNSDSLTNWKKGKSVPCAPNNAWIGIVCFMGNVTSINLAGMGLEGTPDVAAFAPLDDLKAISLENNSLAGPIPAFNFLPGLAAIYASKNQFSGDIPPNYFQPLGSLTRLWLSENKFSGAIPESLGELSSLKELHLEQNEFSGDIPDFPDSEALNIVDLSNNRLQGPIPGPLNKFDKQVFENNPELCGPKASQECPVTEADSPAKLIILVTVVALLIWILSIKDNGKEEHMRISGKDNIDHEAVVAVPRKA